MTKCPNTSTVSIRFLVILVLASCLSACAHSIVISPLETPKRDGQNLCPKNVAYVMTDVDRNKQVTTEGGGGDKVIYFPFRDLEKAIRDSLKAIREREQHLVHICTRNLHLIKFQFSLHMATYSIQHRTCLHRN